MRLLKRASPPPHACVALAASDHGDEGGDLPSPISLLCLLSQSLRLHWPPRPPTELKRLGRSRGPKIIVLSRGFGEVENAIRKRPFTRVSAASWFSGFGANKRTASLPEIVKAGDSILHEPAGEVLMQEIGSEKIQKIIDDMITCMRKVPGVGLAAPQIGVPLKVVSDQKIIKLILLKLHLVYK